MILVCPECATQYEIPNALPEEGAKVRCTSCSHVWLATAADVIESPVEEDVADEAMAAADSAVEEEGIPAVSPADFDPLEDLDFEEVEEPEEDNSQDDIDSLFDEMAANPPEEDNSQDDIDSLFDEIAEPEAEEDNSQDDIDSLFDEMGGDEPEEENSQGDIDSMFDEVAEDDSDNSQDDIDGLFDEPADEGEDNSQDDIDGLFDEEPAAEEAVDEEPQPVAEEEQLEDPFDEAMNEPVAAMTKADEATPAPKKKVPAGPFWKRLEKEVVVGWCCYGMVLGFILFFMVAARVTIVRHMPAMAGIYSSLGLGVNVRGLMFTNVQQRWEVDENRLVLLVEGEITNLTNKYKTLPPLVFGGISADHIEVYRWVMKVRKKPLLPGEKAPFSARVPVPPDHAKQLLISFAK